MVGVTMAALDALPAGALETLRQQSRPHDEYLARAEKEFRRLVHVHREIVPDLELNDVRFASFGRHDVIEFSARFNTGADWIWRHDVFRLGEAMDHLRRTRFTEACLLLWRAVKQSVLPDPRPIPTSNLDVINRALELIGVDPAAADDTLVVYQWLNEEIQRSFMIPAEQQPATTLTVERLDRAMQALRETRGEPWLVEVYQRQRDELLRRQQHEAQPDWVMVDFRAAFGTAPAPYFVRECLPPAPDVVARGEKLLREWLSPAQLKQYDKNQCFEVTGGSTRRRYRIRRGTVYNVEQLDPRGRRLANLCFGPAGHLVSGDVMLAQKIALETNELMALNVANVRSAGVEPLSFVGMTETS